MEAGFINDIHSSIRLLCETFLLRESKIAYGIVWPVLFIFAFLKKGRPKKYS